MGTWRYDGTDRAKACIFFFFARSVIRVARAVVVIRIWHQEVSVLIHVSLRIVLFRLRLLIVE